MIFQYLVWAGDEMIIDPAEIDLYRPEAENLDILPADAGELNSRIRLQPDGTGVKLHLRQEHSFQNWTWGYRLDSSQADSSMGISSCFLKRTFSKGFLAIGSLKIDSGQGMVFGNVFGRIATGAGGFSFTKCRNSFRPSLTGLNYSNSTGLMGQIDQFGIHQVFLGLDDNIEKLFTRFRTQNENTAPVFQMGYIGKFGSSRNQIGFQSCYRLNQTYTGVDNGLTSSITYRIERGLWSLYGESGLNLWSNIVSLIWKNSSCKLVYQFRYLDQNWQTVWGKPVSLLGSGENEAASFIGFIHNTRLIKLESWLHVARDLSPEAGSFVARKSVWLMKLSPNWQNFRWEIQNRVTWMFEDQSVFLDDLEFEQNSPMQKNEVQITRTSQSKPKSTIKLGWLKIQHEIDSSDYGYLVAFRQDWFYQFGLEWQGGFYIFKTDGWDSRFYGSMGGFAGEFQIRPLYGTGCETYLKSKFELGDNCTVDMRGSYFWKGSPESDREFNWAIQLNYKY